MNNLTVKGTQVFLGKEIPVIEGGFGNNQKVVLAKTIAEIHEVEIRKINELINSNIDEFETGIDIIDLKNDENFAIVSKDSGIYSQNSLNASKHIYLLSEQGYMALIGLMRTDKAKQLRKQFRREYFAMREVINSDEQLKAMALLKALEGNSAQDRLEGLNTYTDLKIKEVTLPLIEDNKEKETIINRVISDNGLFALDTLGKVLKPYNNNFGAKKIFSYMRDKGILMDSPGSQKHNMPYDRFHNYFEVKAIDKENQWYSSTYYKTYFTGKGLKWFLGKLVKENEITSSERDKATEQL